MRILLPFVLLLGVCTTSAGRDLRLHECRLPGFEGPARCGSLEVPENPDAPDGRRIPLRIAVLPATGERVLGDPIVPLLGGPGEEAVGAAPYFAERLAALRDERDILLVDQRGTGGSNALDCDLFEVADAATRLQQLFPVAGARRCLAKSRDHADLGQYTYAHAARDLEAVRIALGYDKLNLSAGSYGTRAAQVYMRMFPHSVRTAYLGSVVPLDVSTPETMPRSAAGALERLVESCGADVRCRAAYPALAAELSAIDTALAAGEVKVLRPGSASAVTMSRGRVFEWFRSQLYRPDTANALPATIHAAHGGDWSPIADGIERASRGMASAIAVGLFLAITCRDDIPYIRTAELSATDFRPREQVAACEGWPQASLETSSREPLRTGIPTMFVSGDHDAASPLWFTTRVAPGFTNRVEIIARNQGHTEWSACIAKRYETFVRTGSARRVSAKDCADVALPSFVVTQSAK